MQLIDNLMQPIVPQTNKPVVEEVKEPAKVKEKKQKEVVANKKNVFSQF